MKMKIYIFGSNGMLGNYVTSYLHKMYEIVPLTREDYDLSNLRIDSLKELLINKDIQVNDVIVNCAGIIPQAEKQKNVDTRLYFIINSLFPVILSMLAEQFKVKMIHITTDCVFSGKRGDYNEDDIHDELGNYGISKSLGELCNATIIRTSIIGEEVRNKRSLLEWVKNNNDSEINGYINHQWNGITCLQLAKIIDEIITKDMYWKGVRHIFSPRPVSKYELVGMINEIYKLNIKINEYETEESIDKTISSIYDKDFKIPDLYQQIEEMKRSDI